MRVNIYQNGSITPAAYKRDRLLIKVTQVSFSSSFSFFYIAPVVIQVPFKPDVVVFSLSRRKKHKYITT